MELQNLAEDKFGTGFTYRKPQLSDHVFAAGASTPFDWQKGYRASNELKKKLGASFNRPVKNQYQTKSCGGQGWSYYGETLKVMSDPNPNFVEFSPRYIYSHTYLPGGGSSLYDGGAFCRGGLLPYEQLPSYWSGKPNIESTEEVMRDRGLEGGLESGDNAHPDIYKGLLQLVRGGSTAYVGEDIESIAIAARDNHGCVIAVYGENNGTWFTKFPKAGSIRWGHIIYVDGAVYINGKRYIVILNSWGKDIGEGGYQYLGEEWFNPWNMGGAFTWNPDVNNITRLSDYERLYNIFEADGTLNENYGANWDKLMLTSPVKATYIDFQNYCDLRKFI